MTFQSKLKRRHLWHDTSIVLSILVIMAFSGVIMKDHMFSSFENLLNTNPIQEVSYKIASGDTLWVLASQIVHPDEDVRDKIIAIRKLNGLTPTQSLIPGQIIKIPMKNLDDSGLRYTLRSNL